MPISVKSEEKVGLDATVSTVKYLGFPTCLLETKPSFNVLKTFFFK